MKTSFYSPLNSVAYRRIWVATLFSNLGTWMHLVGASTLISTLTNKPIIISSLQAACMLPIFLFSIPAGILATKFSQSKMLFLTQTYMAAVASIIALMTFYKIMNVEALIILTFLLNIGFAINLPAWQAFAPTLVPKEEIKNAATLNNLSYNFSRMLGPAVGGFLYSWFGPGWVFLLNAASFIGPIIIFYYWRNLDPKPLNHSMRNTTTKITTLLKHVLLKTVIIRSAFYFIFASCVWSILPYLVIVKLHLHSGSLGLLTGCIGIGAVMNALLLYKLRLRFSESSLISFASIITAISIGILAFTQNVILIGLMLFFFGIAWALCISVFNGILQFSFPIIQRSKAIGIYYVAFSLAQVVGSFLIGVLVEFFGYSSALLIFAFLLILNVLMTYSMSFKETNNDYEIS